MTSVKNEIFERLPGSRQDVDKFYPIRLYKLAGHCEAWPEIRAENSKYSQLMMKASHQLPPPPPICLEESSSHKTEWAENIVPLGRAESRSVHERRFGISKASYVTRSRRSPQGAPGFSPFPGMSSTPSGVIEVSNRYGLYSTMPQTESWSARKSKVETSPRLLADGGGTDPLVLDYWH